MAPAARPPDRRTRAGIVSPTIPGARSSRAIGLGLDGRVDLDVLELRAVGQVGGLDGVHERAALERDAAAGGVDARVGQA